MSNPLERIVCDLCGTQCWNDAKDPNSGKSPPKDPKPYTGKFTIVRDDRNQPDWDAIDARIRLYVRGLWDHGIDTFESCEGGPGHAFPEPTIRFHGEQNEGFRALSVALTYHWPVIALRRCYQIYDREPHGPEWEMAFLLPSEPQ